MPAISDYFNVSDSSTQLTLTIYLLGFSLSQLIYGPLSDRFGRRTIIVAGLSIFLLGNLICSLALSHNVLLLCRFIAGAGAGACGVLNRAIASDCFQGAEFSKAWSYTTTALVITLIFAPVLGGYAQDAFGWRANFVLATLLVSASLAIIIRFLPETHSALNPSIQLRVILATYQRILLNPKFLMCTLCYTLAFSGLIIYFQISPLLYINVYGLTATEYGWSSVVIAFSYLSGGLLVTHLAEYLGMRKLLLIGTALLILGGVLMLTAYYFDYANIAAILLSSSIYVLGARIVIPNAIAGSMAEFRHLSGSSSALIGCMQMLGSSVISLLIANCDYDTPLALALFLTLLGIMSLCLALFIKPSVLP